MQIIAKYCWRKNCEISQWYVTFLKNRNENLKKLHTSSTLTKHLLKQRKFNHLPSYAQFWSTKASSYSLTLLLFLYLLFNKSFFFFLLVSLPIIANFYFSYFLEIHWKTEFLLSFFSCFWILEHISWYLMIIRINPTKVQVAPQLRKIVQNTGSLTRIFLYKDRILEKTGQRKPAFRHILGSLTLIFLNRI